jgi:hypothetical protein
MGFAAMALPVQNRAPAKMDTSMRLPAANIVAMVKGCAKSGLFATI